MTALLASTGFPPTAIAACLLGATALGFSAVYSLCPLMLATMIRARTAGADVDGVASSAHYHGGRLVGNLLMSTSAGLAGWILFSPISPVSALAHLHSLPEWLLAFSGTTMMVAGISIFTRPNVGALPFPGPGSLLVRSASFGRAIAYASSKNSPWLLGFVVGIMPCIPLLPVLATAAAAGSPLVGLALGAAFGGGTVLALLARGSIEVPAGTSIMPLATGPLAISTVLVTIAGAFIVVSAAIATIR